MKRSLQALVLASLVAGAGTAFAAPGAVVDPNNNGPASPKVPSNSEMLKFANAIPLTENSNINSALLASGYKITGGPTYRVGASAIQGLYTCRLGNDIYGIVFDPVFSPGSEGGVVGSVPRGVKIPDTYTASECVDYGAGGSESTCQRFETITLKQPAKFDWDTTVQVASSWASSSQFSWYPETFKIKFTVPDCRNKSAYEKSILGL